MKKLFKILTLSLILPSLVHVCFAQPVKNKKFEFSTSASIWNVKFEGTETETVINLPVRLGYFVYKGLEIEAELFLTIPEDEDLGFLFLGNFSYNFKVSEKLMPFILGGGGYGNSEQSFSTVFDYGTNIFVINFGAGTKLLINESSAIRIEYRFTKYMADSEWFDRTDQNLFIGISIFF